MPAINIYLNFNGNTEEVFTFYKSVFGGDFIVLQRFGASPQLMNLSEEDKGKIMHVSLRIGESSVLMGTDAIESLGQQVTAGNNFSIAVDADSEEEALRLFRGLSSGGNVIMPLDKADWGAWFGMLTDKFGIQWMVNYNMPQG